MEDGAEVEKDEGEGGNDGEKGDEERRRDVIEHSTSFSKAISRYGESDSAQICED